MSDKPSDKHSSKHVCTMTVVFSRRSTILALLIMASGCVSGCALQEPINVPVFNTPVYEETNELRGRQSVRRIVMLSFENQAHDRKIGEQLQRQLSTWLRTCGSYEIVGVPAYRYSGCSVASISQGRFSESMLVDVFHRYNADAVLVASVNEFTAYGSLTIGLTLHVVDVRTAEVLASVDGVWNVEDPATKAAFDNFIRSRKTNAYQIPVQARSPQVFADFVMSEVAGHLCRNDLQRPRRKTGRSLGYDAKAASRTTNQRSSLESTIARFLNRCRNSVR